MKFDMEKDLRSCDVEFLDNLKRLIDTEIERRKNEKS